MFENVKAELVTEFLLIFFIAFFGSTAKDYLRIMKTCNSKMSFFAILLSTITASLIVFMFSPVIQEKCFGIRGLMLWSFFVGLMGFRLMEKLDTPEGFLKFLKELFDFFMKR